MKPKLDLEYLAHYLSSRVLTKENMSSTCITLGNEPHPFLPFVTLGLATTELCPDKAMHELVDALATKLSCIEQDHPTTVLYWRRMPEFRQMLSYPGFGAELKFPFYDEDKQRPYEWSNELFKFKGWSITMRLAVGDLDTDLTTLPIHKEEGGDILFL